MNNRVNTIFNKILKALNILNKLGFRIHLTRMQITSLIVFILIISFTLSSVSKLIVAVEEVIYPGYDTLYASGVLQSPRDITTLKGINLDNISSTENYALSNSLISPINEIKEKYSIKFEEDYFNNTLDGDDVVLSDKFRDLTKSDKITQDVLQDVLDRLPKDLNKSIKDNYIEIVLDSKKDKAVDLNKIFYAKSNTLPDIVEINRGLNGFTFTEIDYVNSPSVTALIPSNPNPGHIEFILENGIPVIIRYDGVEDVTPYLPRVGTSIPKYIIDQSTLDTLKQYLKNTDERSKKYGIQGLSEMLLLSLYCHEYQGSSLVGIYDPNFDYNKYYSVLQETGMLSSVSDDNILTDIQNKIDNTPGDTTKTVVDNSTEEDFEDSKEDNGLTYEQDNSSAGDITIVDQDAMDKVTEIDKVTESRNDTSLGYSDDFNLDNLLNPKVNIGSSPNTSSTIQISSSNNNNSSNNSSFWIDDDTVKINTATNLSSSSSSSEYDSMSKEELEELRLKNLSDALQINRTPMIWGVAYNGDNFAIVDKDGSSLLYNAFTKFKYNFTTLAEEDDVMHRLYISKAVPLKTIPRIIPSGLMGVKEADYTIPLLLYGLSFIILIGFIIFLNVYVAQEKRRKRLEITTKERASCESEIFNEFDSYKL